MVSLAKEVLVFGFESITFKTELNVTEKVM